jgi:hypothetical protein
MTALFERGIWVLRRQISFKGLAAGPAMTDGVQGRMLFFYQSVPLMLAALPKATCYDRIACVTTAAHTPSSRQSASQPLSSSISVNVS